MALNALPKGKDVSSEASFSPCSATSTHFLFAQGSVVMVLQHDTLQTERRFTSHQDDIALICADNVSERGAGNLVVTYDVGKMAMIWNLHTGEQVAKFASYEPLLVAAWKKNGNIAFGNSKGDIILFEPATSEHVSARTIYDPITALAPSSDCKTYAIGYNNGTILLASLKPHFNIIHTLSTSRTPSPIAILSWHASSSKQKSDMLAIQNSDGDLRVWSVPKPPTSGIPRVIRVLRRESGEPFIYGRSWVSWSKNGRIIQYSEGGTWAWDVRTKEVNYVPLKVVDFIKGIACHGPTGNLYTLGPEHTVQQYDAERNLLIANIQLIPMTIPPTPPQDHPGQFEHEENVRNGLVRSRTPQSNHSQSQSTSSRKSDHRLAPPGDLSPAKTERTTTTFSQGAYNYNYGPNSNAIPPSPAISTKPPQRPGSRLKQEVIMSPMTPQDGTAVDLFPFLRSRLTQLPARSRPELAEGQATTDDLRQQMLSVVFGWDDDIRALIIDELQRHPSDSINTIFLTKWLSPENDAIIENLGQTPADATLDWIRLALGVLDGRAEGKKVAQVFVEKMLNKGEIHMAAAVLLTVGDKNDAIEVYVSRNCFLEAILLTCLSFPGDWNRQSHLVRRWGEHVVENSQQHLAMRCFSCTGIEPSEAWASPTVQMMNKITSPIAAVLQQQTYPQRPTIQTQSPIVQSVPSLGNPALARIKGVGFSHAQTPVAMPAPPTPFRAAAARGSRITPQTGGLKLVTNFARPAPPMQFPGLRTGDMTPTNATNVTPIAESAVDRSALSPGGLGSYKANNMRSLDAALGQSRLRMPSIGETPIDTDIPVFSTRLVNKAPPTPDLSESDKEKDKTRPTLPQEIPKDTRPEDEPTIQLLPAAAYKPTQTPVQEPHNATPQTALRPNNVTTWQSSLDNVQEDPNARMRRPSGLSLQTSMDDTMTPIIGPSRPGTTDSTQTHFTMGSPIDSARVKSPSVSGRSLDQYISSLEMANEYRTRSRNSNRKYEDKRRYKKDKYTEDRFEGSSGKRSPTSPVPMSPDDLRTFARSVESFDSVYNSANSAAEASVSSINRRGSVSTSGTSKHKNRSQSTTVRRRVSNAGRHSPGLNDRRGRSKSRKETPGNRSPSSPLPMVPSEEDRASVESNAFRFVSANRSRLARSTSRRPERATSAVRGSSPDRRRNQARSPSVGRELSGRNSAGYRDTIEQLDALAESIKANPRVDMLKDAAQAELEARRLSLTRKSSAPPIPPPGSERLHVKSASDGISAPPLMRNLTDSVLRTNNPRTLITSQSAQALRGAETFEGDDTFQLPARTYSRDTMRDADNTVPFEIPHNMPRHPAFDHRVGTSRNTSRSRTRAEPDRQYQGELSEVEEIPAVIIGSPETGHHSRPSVNGVTIIPELQHLAQPPPPPPPPAPPKKDLRINTELPHVPKSQSKSAFPPSAEGSANTPESKHRRQKSASDDKFMSKFRGFSERMRSTSRPRDNTTRSPNNEYDGIMSPYETKTMMPNLVAGLNSESRLRYER